LTRQQLSIDLAPPHLLQMASPPGLPPPSKTYAALFPIRASTLLSSFEYGVHSDATPPEQSTRAPRICLNEVTSFTADQTLPSTVELE
jgi:hypothetical protein